MTKYERLGAPSYRRGWEPGPAIMKLDMTPALVQAGYRPPEAMLKREKQIVWLGFYEEEDKRNANATSRQGQTSQNNEVDNIKSTRGKGHSNPNRKSVHQEPRDDLGRSITESASARTDNPNWPFKRAVGKESEATIRNYGKTTRSATEHYKVETSRKHFGIRKK